jgi:hypothetical protein
MDQWEYGLLIKRNNELRFIHSTTSGPRIQLFANKGIYSEDEKNEFDRNHIELIEIADLGEVETTLTHHYFCFVAELGLKGWEMVSTETVNGVSEDLKIWFKKPAIS